MIYTDTDTTRLIVDCHDYTGEVDGVQLTNRQTLKEYILTFTRAVASRFFLSISGVSLSSVPDGEYILSVNDEEGEIIAEELLLKGDYVVDVDTYEHNNENKVYNG